MREICRRASALYIMFKNDASCIGLMRPGWGWMNVSINPSGGEQVTRSEAEATGLLYVMRGAEWRETFTSSSETEVAGEIPRSTVTSFRKIDTIKLHTLGPKDRPRLFLCAALSDKWTENRSTIKYPTVLRSCTGSTARSAGVTGTPRWGQA